MPPWAFNPPVTHFSSRQHTTGDPLMDHLTIKLQHPTEFDGIRRDTLTLRAPLVRDMRLASRQAPTDAEERELILFGILAGVAPKDLEGMRFTDYKRLQDSYFRLVSARPDDRASAEPTDEATGAGTALPAL
ncbi:phage tail assembly protein [Escherichia coli]